MPDYQIVDTVLCAGEPIEITTAYPDIHDMNFDGLNDLILGSSSGKIACFINSGTPQQPVFEEMEYLRADGEELYICSYVRPMVCHWNSDSIPDLLVGDYTGQIHLFTGVPHAGADESRELSVSLLSNPVSHMIPLRIELDEPVSVRTSIFSVDGRVLRIYNHGSLQQGVHALQLDTEGLPDGICFISIGSAVECRVFKVVVSR